ncbi:uncharacterized protein GIQ15_01976 [Arthroderma uncinatum]|uniref:uncharacterized protein n=1 Tax=Arthroderma uncinatum TaxID=74035 RepID=UPI00144A76E3|nr:uncharacterized protein GIQ15_01976 [Arthroderma uncinatum]KAF3482652.1 hypothetical protein GIQ15_01976 [Arthroderma uncinatum]
MISLPATVAGGNNLVALPLELFLSILSFLPNRDIKALRLTGSSIRDRARLRLDRVFLSANRRNIEVFRAIANHETFRQRVVEIIWDDARLIDWPLEDAIKIGGELYCLKNGAYYENITCGCNDLCDCDTARGCPAWFTRACRKNIENLTNYKHYDVYLPGRVPRAYQVTAQHPTRQSWEYYQGLLRIQKAVLASGADISAFRFGLEQFPALQRITITPAGHGFLFAPLYETPMIRDFPYGFNYPIPRSWPIMLDGIPTEACEWVADSYEMQRNQWRGFQIVMRALAQAWNHRITELVIDVNQLPTGLNCRIFDQPCREYDDLVLLLERPSFSRLDLSLLVGGLEHDDWPSFRRGLLRRALAKAVDLQHISLCTDVIFDPAADASISDSGGSIKHFIPLQSIFPVERWPRLRHFGLSGFLVMQTDVLKLLAALPPTVRSIELNFLYFLDGGGDYCDLLVQMRDTLSWRNRAVEERPRVSIGTEEISLVSNRRVWVDDEVTEFLYYDGENPFWAQSPNNILKNSGIGIVRDAFEPEYERPYVNLSTLMKLGYKKQENF